MTKLQYMEKTLFVFKTKIGEIHLILIQEIDSFFLISIFKFIECVLSNLGSNYLNISFEFVFILFCCLNAFYKLLFSWNLFNGRSFRFNKQTELVEFWILLFIHQFFYLVCSLILFYLFVIKCEFSINIKFKINVQAEALLHFFQRWYQNSIYILNLVKVKTNCVGVNVLKSLKLGQTLLFNILFKLKCMTLLILSVRFVVIHSHYI